MKGVAIVTTLNGVTLPHFQLADQVYSLLDDEVELFRVEHTAEPDSLFPRLRDKVIEGAKHRGIELDPQAYR